MEKVVSQIALSFYKKRLQSKSMDTFYVIVTLAWNGNVDVWLR